MRLAALTAILFIVATACQPTSASIVIDNGAAHPWVVQVDGTSSDGVRSREALWIPPSDRVTVFGGNAIGDITSLANLTVLQYESCDVIAVIESSEFGADQAGIVAISQMGEVDIDSDARPLQGDTPSLSEDCTP